MPTTLIVGFGYLGREVAKLAICSGATVFATTRSRQKFPLIASSGCIPLQIDWTDARSLHSIPPVDRILVAVAYDPSSRRDRETSMVVGLRRLLDRVSKWPPTNGLDFPRMTYISTTGVYHQGDGQWVDENSTTRPERPGGKTHLRAEASLRAWSGQQNPWQAVTLRLSGLYGRGRIPRAAQVRTGQPIASPERGYLNLIHVHDAARAVLASWECGMGAPYQTVCISDHEPVIRRSFYEYIARYYRAPPPTFVEPEADAPVRIRSLSNKRVWNRRMLRQLLPKLVYPSYREGLIDALAIQT